MKKVLLLISLILILNLVAQLYAVDLSEGFEGTSFPPDGWTVINGGDDYTWERADARSHSGSYSAIINWTPYAHNDWLISHKCAPTAGNHSYIFWAANEDNVLLEAFNVKLSTTGREMADFNVTLGSNLVPGTAFQQYSFDLSAYVGQNVYVAIQAISTDMYRLYIDDVSGSPLALEAEPSNHVTNIAASQNGSDAIIVSWTGSTGIQIPDKYLIMVKNTGGSYASVADGTPVSDDSNWSDSNMAKNVWHTLGTNTCTFSGFSAGDVCSIIIYPYTNFGESINFLTTTPVPEISITINEEGFFEGFEGSSFPPDGWTVVNGGDANTWQRSGGLSHSGSYSASIEFTENTHNDWLISHRLATSANYNYTFWAANEHGNYLDAFNVLLSTTGREIADFNVTLGSNIVPGTAFQEYVFDLNAYVGQNVYIAIQAISTDMYCLFIDDVSGPPFASEVTPPNPATPVDPVDIATDIILHPTLTWAAGGGFPTGYKLYLGSDGNGTAQPTNIVNNLNLGANLSYHCTTLLTPNTVYYWQIVPYNAGGNAANCPIWSFTTTGPEVITGNCLEFDGTDDNITGTGISTTLSAFTIETWVYHNSLPGTVQRYVTLSPEVAVLRYDGTIYGGYRSLHFYITKANGSGLGVRADSVLVTGEWMHIAGTYDGTNLKLYVNGTLVKSAVSAGAGLYAPSGVYSFSSSGEALNGKLDEVRIWNYARSATQIRESRHHSQSGTASGLQHYWQFNKSMGTTATDVIGGCDGTLNNMTDADWIVSTTPLGTGVSYTRTEATGLVSFTGTDLSINYTTHNSASVTVSKLNTNPNLIPTAVNAAFYNQYWIVSRYGTGTFNGNMTLTVSEDLSDDDQLHPNQIRLYYRSSCSDGSWTALTSAISVNAALNQATFSGISETGQFLVCRDYPATSNQIGTALSFNGSDEYLNVGNSSSLDVGNVLTVEAWVKPNSITAREGIFSTRFNNASGSFQFELGTGSAGTGRVAVSGVSTWVAQTGDNAIATGEWVHLAYTRTGSGAGTSKIYINGVLQTLINNEAYTFVNNTGDKVIGSGTSGGQFFNGSMDEVRVWNIARTADQIRESMYLSLAGTETGLVSYWQCNEAGGTLTKDNISTNNGTMLNMGDANWVTSPLPFAAGTANSQNEASGTVTFTGTGLSSFFTSSSGARLTVSKLNSSPNVVPASVTSVYDDQYWEINRFGTGSFNADLTFTVNEDLTADNEANPGNIKLYSRSSHSDAAWTLLASAVSVNAAANTATFAGITGFSQFILAYAAPIALAAPLNVTIDLAEANIQINWDSVSGAQSYKVYASDLPDSGFVEVTSAGDFRARGNSMLDPVQIDSKTNSMPQNELIRSRVSWTCAESGAPAKFYYIKSSPDLP